MSEGAAEQDKKIFPGGIDRYRELQEAASKVDPADPQFAGLVVAAELAGLAYIADGIRYSLRK